MRRGGGQSALGARERHFVDEADKAFARLAQLMTELSDIGKLDAGQVSMATRPVDLFTLASEVAADTHEAEDRGVHVDVRGLKAGAIISGDPDRLRAAIDAILKSVLREQHGPCTIVVDRRRRATAGADAAAIVVADEARLQAADASAAVAFDDKRGGLGLALPIARRTIEAHGGRVSALADGGVIITLPLAT